MRRAAQQPEEVGSSPKPNTKIEGRRDAHADPPAVDIPLPDLLLAPERRRDFSGRAARTNLGGCQCALGGLDQYLSRQWAANFDMAFSASSLASRWVAYDCGDRR